jgi:hypothetical protein
MKFFHEAPNCYFEEVQKITDGDYFLVHLFEQNETYLNHAINASKKGREVILDNSAFELGDSFDPDLFAYWVERTNPTYYIVPDALEKAQLTMDRFDRFTAKYSNLPGKLIGVAQGETYDEFVRCYQYLVNRVDKIAISFDYAFFNQWTSHLSLPTKYHEWMVGRQSLLFKMIEDRVVNVNVPHHLLGTGLPQEITGYAKYEWIDSIDTSNPIVHAIEGIEYTPTGLESKSATKLHTLIDVDYNEGISYNIKRNIELYKGFLK